MIFGIDLGTTNSLIGRGTTFLSELIPSTVNIKTNEQKGRDEFGDDILSSYKINMSMSESGKLPIACSSIILKTLAGLVERRIGEIVKDVVISVPAYFVTSQREAVVEAAKEAGLNPVLLINEPTAAAIYVSKEVKDIYVVYDLGGGTFDITIIDPRSGQYVTIATDGKNIGGDNLDQALLDFVIKKGEVKVRYRTPEAMQRLRVEVRKAKELIQKTRSNVYVNMSAVLNDSDVLLTVEEYKDITRQTFGETIEKTMQLIDTYIDPTEDPKMIYTGGSTYCPFLMEMLYEEIPYMEVKYKTEKDMLVAHGVSYVAELVEQGKADSLICDVTKRLCIENSDGFSITIIDSNSILPTTGTAIVSNSKKTNKLELRLYQGNSSVARKNEYIGTLVYDYGRVVDVQEGDVVVDVRVSADGIVKLTARELMDDKSISTKLTLR